MTTDAAAEGMRPTLIIEVTSSEMNKQEAHDLVEVPLYVIVDVGEQPIQQPIRLLGYRQVGGVYEELPPDDQGRLWLEPVKLWLGIEDGKVYCYTSADARSADQTEIATLADAHLLRAEAEAPSEADASYADGEELQQPQAGPERESEFEIEADSGSQWHDTDQHDAEPMIPEMAVEVIGGEATSTMHEASQLIRRLEQMVANARFHRTQLSELSIQMHDLAGRTEFAVLCRCDACGEQPAVMYGRSGQLCQDCAERLSYGRA